MAKKLSKKVRKMENDLWWGVAFRGVAALIFGVAAVFWSDLTLVTLITLFAAFIIITGVISAAIGFFAIGRGNFRWLRDLIVGLVEIGVGVYLVRHPGVAVGVFVTLVSVVFIVRGLVEATVAWLERRAVATEKVLVFAGAALSIAVGLAILFYPIGAGVTFVWLIGLFALIEGALLLALAMDMRKNTK